MTLTLCGSNDHYQFGEESNGIDIYDYPAIYPAIDSTFKVDSISSYSSYYNHTVIITNDGQALGAGDNSDGKIIGSLKKQVLSRFTKFEIKDKKRKTWIPFSAVCGEKYTLYLVSESKTGLKMQLAYSYSGLETKYPLFLNTGKSNPVSLFGGHSFAAAINSEGAIIIITELVIDTPDEPIEAIYLPDKEKAISIACCKDFIIALSKNNKVFLLNLIETDDSTPSKSTGLKFTLVKELQKTKIVNISGTTSHFFAVTDDGRVFGRGSNCNGQLGIGKEKEELEKFTEILPLNKYKIEAAYAGGAHSLFQTMEGKIIACGSNGCASIPGHKPSKSHIYLPVETGIDKGATFCVVGDCFTAIFINYLPKGSPNLQKTSRNTIITESSEIARLKAEIVRLQNRIKVLESSNESKSEFQLYDQEEINEFRIIEPIGRGAQSEVLKAARDQLIAIKVLNTVNLTKSKSKKSTSTGKKDDQDISFTQLKKFLQEYEIIRSLSHPNVISAYGFCYGDETHFPSIVLQYCPNNLDDIISDMENLQKICAIYEICLGMEAVHAANLIHRDLKPSNILFDQSSHVKISDFGVSCFIDIEDQTKSMTGAVGTIKYMAPELLKEEHHYNNKVDVYSFGVVLFYILTGGQLPNINMVDQANGVKANIPKSVNDLSKELILKCWEKNPDNRPSFSDIVGFIKKNNFKLINGADKLISSIKSFLSI